MNKLTPAPRLVHVLSAVCAVIIAVLPFHALLTVWGASLGWDYTLLRLWKEFLLAFVLAGCLVLLVRNRRLAAWRQDRTVFWLFAAIAAYFVVLLGSGMAALLAGTVTPKALAYGLLLDTRFLLFFLAVWLTGQYSGWIRRHWQPLLLVPATVVIVFGLLQFFVLPPDYLQHFGYGPATIEAVQTVDEKSAYQRIQSTLRGANPLGAYLILIVSAAGVLLLAGGLKIRSFAQRWTYALLLAAALLALALTFSRSAWLGAAASLGLLTWLSVRTSRGRQGLVLAGSIAVLVFAAGGFALQDNDVFQNTFLHTDENSRSLESSNENHFEASGSGLNEIMAEPLGAGAGTAGPASVYNDGVVRIAENYYIQIGQEAGIIGAALAMVVFLLAAVALWCRREQPLALVLFASLIGLSLVNLLSHAWTDDTLSYIWWGLAGAVLATGISPRRAVQQGKAGDD